MRFEYWKSDDSNWTWRLKTTVGDVLATGCAFPSRENCLASIKLVKLAASAPLRDISASNRATSAEAALMCPRHVLVS